MKVLLTIPLSSFSGYGRDGIGLTRALMKAGVDVYLRPKVVQAPLPADVAMLLTKELEAPFDLSICHVDPMALDLENDVKLASKMNIGWTMWEFSSTANLYGRSTLKERQSKFDAMVYYDEVSKYSLGAHLTKSTPAIKQQGGSEFGDWSYIDRDWDEEDFYFGMVGAPLSTRKNPFAFIQAFSELKNEDPIFDKHARAMLKTSVDDQGFHPKMEDVYPGLRIFADTWSTEVLAEFYAKLHCLVAPSRGEGKHLPSLEFQATGGPVIATNWGGMAEWLDPAYSYPLNNFSLTQMNNTMRGSLTAEVDIEELKGYMRHVFYNRQDAKEKGLLASQIIPEKCSWDAVVVSLMAKLRDNVPGGEDLWGSSPMCM